MANQSGSLVYYIVHWVVSAVALLITSKIIPGFSVTDFGSAMWAAVAIGIANVIVWPVLIFLTLPINVLTLGLFTFVVNGAVLKICTMFLSGFEIKGWWPAIFGSIALSFIGGILHYFFA